MCKYRLLESSETCFTNIVKTDELTNYKRNKICKAEFIIKILCFTLCL